MEDSFSVRVDKVFGNLSSPTFSKPISSALWSLTDEEIEKREWNRETDDEKDSEAGGAEAYPKCDGIFSKDRLMLEEKDSEVRYYEAKLEDDLEELEEIEELQELEKEKEKETDKEDNDEGEEDEEEEEEEEDDERSGGRLRRTEKGAGVDIESEIKKIIGMDCTLDYENEEDEFDKVAVGSDKYGKRLYLRDVTNSASCAYTRGQLPNTIKDVRKDPRANHSAAKLRLREDAEAAKDMNGLRVSDAPEGVPNDLNSKDVKQVLKRKDKEVDTASEKRARFHPESETDGVKSFVSQDSSAVPDHVRNPSKYKQYAFDDSDLDDTSNKQACMEFLNTIRKSKQLEPDEPPADLSKPVIFNPKKKTRDPLASTEQNKDTVMRGLEPKKSVPVAASAGDAEEEAACDMEEDNQQIEFSKVSSGKKVVRQYRLKVNAERDDI